MPDPKNKQPELTTQNPETNESSESLQNDPKTFADAVETQEKNEKIKAKADRLSQKTKEKTDSVLKMSKEAKVGLGIAGLALTTLLISKMWSSKNEAGNRNNKTLKTILTIGAVGGVPYAIDKYTGLFGGKYAAIIDKAFSSDDEKEKKKDKKTKQEKKGNNPETKDTNDAPKDNDSKVKPIEQVPTTPENLTNVLSPEEWDLITKGYPDYLAQFPTQLEAFDDLQQKLTSEENSLLIMQENVYLSGNPPVLIAPLGIFKQLFGELLKENKYQTAAFEGKNENGILTPILAIGGLAAISTTGFYLKGKFSAKETGESPTLDKFEETARKHVETDINIDDQKISEEIAKHKKAGDIPDDFDESIAKTSKWKKGMNVLMTEGLNLGGSILAIYFIESAKDPKQKRQVTTALLAGYTLFEAQNVIHAGSTKTKIASKLKLPKLSAGKMMGVAVGLGFALDLIFEDKISEFLSSVLPDFGPVNHIFYNEVMDIGNLMAIKNISEAAAHTIAKSLGTKIVENRAGAELTKQSVKKAGVKMLDVIKKPEAMKRLGSWFSRSTLLRIPKRAVAWSTGKIITFVLTRFGARGIASTILNSIAAALPPVGPQAAIVKGILMGSSALFTLMFAKDIIEIIDAFITAKDINALLEERNKHQIKSIQPLNEQTKKWLEEHNINPEELDDKTLESILRQSPGTLSFKIEREGIAGYEEYSYRSAIITNLKIAYEHEGKMETIEMTSENFDNITVPAPTAEEFNKHIQSIPYTWDHDPEKYYDFMLTQLRMATHWSGLKYNIVDPNTVEISRYDVEGYKLTIKRHDENDWRIEEFADMKFNSFIAATAVANLSNDFSNKIIQDGGRVGHFEVDGTDIDFDRTEHYFALDTEYLSGYDIDDAHTDLDYQRQKWSYFYTNVLKIPSKRLVEALNRGLEKHGRLSGFDYNQNVAAPIENEFFDYLGKNAPDQNQNPQEFYQDQLEKIKKGDIRWRGLEYRILSDDTILIERETLTAPKRKLQLTISKNHDKWQIKELDNLEFDNFITAAAVANLANEAATKVLKNNDSGHFEYDSDDRGIDLDRPWPDKDVQYYEGYDPNVAEKDLNEQSKWLYFYNNILGVNTQTLLFALNENLKKHGLLRGMNEEEQTQHQRKGKNNTELSEFTRKFFETLNIQLKSEAMEKFLSATPENSENFTKNYSQQLNGIKKIMDWEKFEYQIKDPDTIVIYQNHSNISLPKIDASAPSRYSLTLQQQPDKSWTIKELGGQKFTTLLQAATVAEIVNTSLAKIEVTPANTVGNFRYDDGDIDFDWKGPGFKTHYPSYDLVLAQQGNLTHRENPLFIYNKIIGINSVTIVEALNKGLKHIKRDRDHKFTDPRIRRM